MHDPALTVAIVTAATICYHDPKFGANPLGMRSYVEIVTTGAVTRLQFDAFGNAANEDAAHREIVLAAPLPRARALLRTRPALLDALTGSPGNDLETAQRLDRTMTCERADAATLARLSRTKYQRVPYRP